MPVQTVYTKRMKQGLPGLVGWDFGSADITSVVAEGTIPFGNAVIQGTKARTGIVGSANVLGFAVRSLMSINAINTFTDAYGDDEVVGVLRTGYIWSVNNGSGAIADGSQVYVNATGQVVNSAAAGAVAVPGSRVETGGAVGALVFLRIQTAIPAPAAP